MKVHQLHQEQVLNLSIEDAWEFFSRPQNLDTITPPDMKFRITSESIPDMFEGQIITYRIQLAPMIWKTWVTEIKAMVPGRSFVDEQRFGPYKFWHHRHELIPDGKSKTKMTDEIHYALGFGPFGALAHGLFVEKKLKSIFEFRRRILDQKFNQLREPPSTGNSKRENPAESTIPPIEAVL